MEKRLGWRGPKCGEGGSLGTGASCKAVPSTERAQRHRNGFWVSGVNIFRAGGILTEHRTFLLYCAMPKVLGNCDCNDDDLCIKFE